MIMRVGECMSPFLIERIPMRSNLRVYGIICAACLVAAFTPAFADRGDNPGNGNGHAPPHPPGPPNPPPAPPPTRPWQHHVKTHPPHGACSADDTPAVGVQGLQ